MDLNELKDKFYKIIIEQEQLLEAMKPYNERINSLESLKRDIMKKIAELEPKDAPVEEKNKK